jgi:hypothetical protein
VSKRNSSAAILLETVIVVAVAAAFAFFVNKISPRGLDLQRDYFPRAAAPAHAPVQAPPAAAAGAISTNEESEAEETDQRIKEKGLQPISRAETLRLFKDPRYQQGLIVFMDARAADHYAESHIPGAYALDRYHPEKDLAEDLTPCQNAEEIVVYCTGGGFEDWSASHLPLEQGARNSGLAPSESK